MPTLAQSRRPFDPNKFQRVEPPQAAAVPAASLEPVFNPTIRCPLPPITATPDTLRQFYRAGIVPQNRIFGSAPLSGNNNSGGGGSTSTTVIESTSSTTTVLPTAKNASITTPVLGPGASYLGVVSMAKTFTLLQIALDQPARVELYSTASFQALDAGRPAFLGGIPNPPAAGTEHGVITDLYSEVSGLWIMSSDAVGSNADAPQTALIYVSVTNVAASNVAITASLTYVPNQS